MKKHTRPPEDQGGWFGISLALLESPAYRTLSLNARRAFDRLLIEHIGHGRLENGRLTVTHEQFIDYGVTLDLIADALDEMIYKGLLRAERGKAGNGTAHPTVFTLTFDGIYDGASASNEWKKFTMAEARLWSEAVRKQKAEMRAKVGRKKKSSLGDVQIPPLGDFQIRRLKSGDGR
ncbi:hypothetical protein [Mesorhizobium sp. A556]